MDVPALHCWLQARRLHVQCLQAADEEPAPGAVAAAVCVARELLAEFRTMSRMVHVRAWILRDYHLTEQAPGLWEG